MTQNIVGCCCIGPTCCCPSNLISRRLYVVLRQLLTGRLASDIVFVAVKVTPTPVPAFCTGVASADTIWEADNVPVGTQTYRFRIYCCNPGLPNPCFFICEIKNYCEDVPGSCPFGCSDTNDSVTIGSPANTQCDCKQATTDCCNPLCEGPVPNTNLPSIFGPTCNGYTVGGIELRSTPVS